MEEVNRRPLLRDADWGGMLLLGTRRFEMIYCRPSIQGNRLDWLGIRARVHGAAW